MKSKVAVLKTNPEAVVEDYGKLMRLAGYLDLLDKDKKTHLSVNLSSDVWFPGSSTPPWQIEGVARALLDDGFAGDSIDLVLNPTADIDERAGEANNGYTTVAERNGLGISRLSEPSAEWAPYHPKADLLMLDKLPGGEGLFLPESFPDTNIIHLPTTKTSLRTVIDGSVNNVLGGFRRGGLPLAGSAGDEILVDLLAIQKEIHAGVFAVMDGVICGDGPGPRLLQPYLKDYIVAGADPVAVDAVAARMMGFNPMDIGFIRLAHERGLGCGAFDEIEIVGEDIAAVDFQFRGGGKAAPAGSSKFYYEYFWYPFIGWPRLNRVAETEWGQLFQRYLPEGAELEKQGRGKGDLAAMVAAGLLGLLAAGRMLHRKKE